MDRIITWLAFLLLMLLFLFIFKPYEALRDNPSGARYPNFVSIPPSPHLPLRGDGFKEEE